MRDWFSNLQREYIKALKEVQKQRTRSKGINAGVTNSASIPEKEKEDPLVDRMFRSLDSQVSTAIIFVDYF